MNAKHSFVRQFMSAHNYFTMSANNNNVIAECTLLTPMSTHSLTTVARINELQCRRDGSMLGSKVLCYLSVHIYRKT